MILVGFALVLLALLGAPLFTVIAASAMWSFHQAEIDLMERNRAQLVLENVVERAGAEPRLTPALLDVLLQAELRESPLHRSDRYEAETATADDNVRLVVKKAGGPVLGVVEVGP